MGSLGKSRNLVVLRAGSGSLHPAWFTPDRDFDLIVDAWGERPEQYEGTCDVLLRGFGDTATLAFHRLFTEMPHLLTEYDCVWMTADDIETTTSVINALFALHRESGFSLAQPALTPDSYFTHSIVLQHQGLSVRQVDFVESMVPLFTSEALAAVLPTFEQTPHAWGLDSVWPAILAPLGGRCAVYDCLPVRHTRPVGGNQGTTAEVAHLEAVRLVDRCGLPPGILGKRVLGAWDVAFQQVPPAGMYQRLAAAFPKDLANDPLEWDVYANALGETRSMAADGFLLRA